MAEAGIRCGVMGTSYLSFGAHLAPSFTASGQVNGLRQHNKFLCKSNTLGA
jgi:hypothetical protein